MGIQVGFFLRDLQKAVYANEGFQIVVGLKEVSPSVEYYTNEDDNPDWRNVPGYRDDEVIVIDPQGVKYCFHSSYNCEDQIRFWFSNKNVNYHLLDLLDRLKVPYDRG